MLCLGLQNQLYCRYVYTYEEFVFVTEASSVQQNDRTKTHNKIQVNKE